MQKRRAHNSELPLVDTDVPTPRSSKLKSRGRQKRNEGVSLTQLFGYLLMIGFALCGLYLMMSIVTGRDSASGGDGRRVEQADLVLPLSQYSSLDYALKHSRLVAVYFAASWCSMSTPVTKLIDQVLNDVLLPPPSPDHPPPLERAPISLVYVSSDRNMQDFVEYQRKSWVSVPFESSDLTALKKQFSVCAKQEVSTLGIDRKFEIPTLIILDGETHGVITTNGAEDLMDYQHLALEHWTDLQNLVRAMEDKYADNGQGLIKSQDRRVHHADSFSSLFS
jgi:hypothetical protein